MGAVRQRILLIDDSKEDRFLIKQALANAALDCEVMEAAEGEEADVRLQRHVGAGDMPHFVLLDLNLPKRSGLELMETWSQKGFTKLTRVIVLSSLLTEAQVVKLEKLGAWLVIEKPRDLNEFLELGRRVKELSLGDWQAPLAS
jgi:DNA-binding response OmpR family regulator